MSTNHQPYFLLISPHYPPDQSGLADHSAQLCKVLAQIDHVSILSKKSNISDNDNLIKIIENLDRTNINKIINFTKKTSPKYIWVQYVPHMYSKRGLSFNILKLVRMLKTTLPDTKIIIMWHELYMQRNWPIHYYIYKLIHIYKMKKLLKFGNIHFVNCHYYKKQIEKYASNVFYLPVGSNITTASKSKQKPNDYIHLCLFGGEHLSKKQFLLLDMLEKFLNEYPDHKFKVSLIGLTLPKKSHALKKVLLTQGRKSEEQASHIISSSHYMLTYFTDGLTSRRGSAMASLAHGTSLISTSSEHTEEIFNNAKGVYLLDKCPKLFYEELKSLLLCDFSDHTQVLKEIYQNNFSWEKQNTIIHEVLSE